MLRHLKFAVLHPELDSVAQVLICKKNIFSITDSEWITAIEILGSFGWQFYLGLPGWM